MTASVRRFDEKARRGFGKLGHTTIHEGELFRHPVYTRFLHWTSAILFFLALLSGLAIYSPWLFHWLTPLFGGGPTTRVLHPWFGLDRKSTRLNSSHLGISYAVFCLKKKISKLRRSN